MSVLALSRGLLSRRGDRLFLNFFALMGAFVGLANAALAWRLYGATLNADVWMLALMVSQALCLLSQLGVEQVAVFSSEAHARSAESGHRFDRDSLTWAVGYGVSFAVLLALFNPYLVAVFAHGYATAQRQSVSEVLLPLLLQVACTPPIYVLRQQLLLRGRARISIVSNNVFGYAQFAVLLGALFWPGVTPVQLACVVSGLSVVSIAWLVVSLCEPGVLRSMPDWRSLWPFIRASVAMRSVHSIHNFLVVLLTSSTLSRGVEGTVAVFQYVKKIADGLASISVGPHMSVYHAAQARAWALRERHAFGGNIRAYLASAFPLLLLVTLAFAGALGLSLHFFPAVFGRIGLNGLATLFVLLAWQALIAAETMPVGVLVIDHRSGFIAAINGLFVLNFFLVLQYALQPPFTGLAVATASLGCQCISTVLFSYVASKLMRRRFHS